MFLDLLVANGVMARWEDYLGDPSLSAVEKEARKKQFQDFSHYIDLMDESDLIPTDNLSPDKIQKFLTLGTTASGVWLERLENAQSDALEDERETLEKLSSFRDTVDYIQSHLSWPQFAKITDFDQLWAGKYIISDRGSDQKKHWRIDESDKLFPDGKRGIRIHGYSDMGEDAGAQNWTYEQFADRFMSEVQETRGILVADDPDFLDPTLGYTLDTIGNFQDKIDEIDSENRGKTLKAWMACTVKINWKKEYIRIKAIDEWTKTIQLQDFTGQDLPPLSWAEFLRIIDPEMDSKADFHRYSDISTPENFVANAGIAGLGFKDRKFVFGEDEKTKKPSELWGFRHKEKDKYLEVQFDATNNKVTLTEYSKIKKQGEPWKKKKDIPTGPQIKWVKIAEKYSLEFLKQYIDEEGFTLPVNYDPIKQAPAFQDDGTVPGEHGHWHHRSKWWMLAGLRNFHDIGKAFKMGLHMFEHMIEESHELHASEALYNFFLKTRGANDSLTIHAMGEFAGKVGEMVDKKMNHLKRLSAAPRRAEIRHILLTKPPKPFDLMAAMTVTVEMSGVLYPDSHLDDLQGNNYLWFRQLCNALNYNYNDEINAAIGKEQLENVNSPHIHETILITRFLKSHSEENPYIQSFKGGSKFWWAVVQWRNGQMEKGKNEVKERDSGQGRKEYIMAKYKSNELEIVAWGFPELYDKSIDPGVLGPAFVWSMSNATRIAHPTLLQNFRNNILAHGLSFHALSFSGNNADGKIYQDTVTLVVEQLQKSWKLPLEAKKTLEKLNSVRDANPDGHNPELYLDLGKFWDSYHAILNPVLQWADPMLFLLLEDPKIPDAQKSTVRKYVDTLRSMTGAGRLKDKEPNPTLLQYGAYDYKNSIIFDTTNDGTLFSLKLQLSYMQLNSRTGEMYQKKDQELWNQSIVPYLEALRTNANFRDNESYQKRQFLVVHDEIMNFLRSSIPQQTYKDALITQSYFRQLNALGFDVNYENVFQNTGLWQKIDFGWEAAYGRFRNSQPGTGRIISGVRKQTQQAMEMGSSGAWNSQEDHAGDEAVPH